MKITVEIGNDEVRAMLIEKVHELMPNTEVDDTKILIQVKSAQNYRVHDWESGQIKVTYEEVTL